MKQTRIEKEGLLNGYFLIYLYRERVAFMKQISGADIVCPLGLGRGTARKTRQQLAALSERCASEIICYALQIVHELSSLSPGPLVHIAYVLG